MQFRLKDVTVRYGTASAVENISMDMAEGEIVSIVGANGAGKSTVLKTISGLVPLHAGEIWFKEERIDGKPAHEIVKRGIAQVPENRRLFPYMSVLSNLRLGAYCRKDKAQIREDLEDILRLFPILNDRINQNAGTMSGGEQQMIAIGRALMTKPKLLLLDEPSLGLAPKVIEMLAGVILQINKKGLGMLLVEQNAGLVLNVTKRAYVIEVGKIVFQGNIREMIANDLIRRSFLGG
jgi:branched-chain amino acid transport system ATP-binding protein